MTRPTVAEIDLDAIAANLARVREQCPQHRVQAVIKADAYGHGALKVAQRLQAQVDAFAVAIWEEAQALRDAGVVAPLVVLEGPNEAAEVQAACGKNIEWVVHRSQQLDWLIENQRGSGPAGRCWLKVNVGMNRLGMAIEELARCLPRLQAEGRWEVGLMTHFGCAECPDSTVHQSQLERIYSLRESWPDLEFSCANSAASLGPTPPPGEWIRPGIALYGSSPFADRSATELGLRPTLYLYSQLIAVRDLKAGDSVGYGASWTAEQATRMGVLPLGYADGIPRQLSNTGKVCLQSAERDMIGRISMDLITIDLGLQSEAAVGERVEIWGQGVSVDRQAALAGTIGYELLAGLGTRVPRVYRPHSAALGSSRQP